MTDPPEIEREDVETDQAKWITTACNLGNLSKKTGETFINQVEQMRHWSLDDLISYLKTWSDKTRLTNVLSYDHLRDATLVSIQADGELRALSTRYDINSRRSVVNRVNLPYWCQGWTIVTNGRSFNNSEGGFAAGNQYRKPRGGRGHSNSPYSRGGGGGYRSSGYRRY